MCTSRGSPCFAIYPRVRTPPGSSGRWEGLLLRQRGPVCLSEESVRQPRLGHRSWSPSTGRRPCAFAVASSATAGHNISVLIHSSLSQESWHSGRIETLDFNDHLM